MNKRHTVTLVAALAVACATPNFIGESSKAQARQIGAPHPPASKQDGRFMPRVTTSTSTALVSSHPISADPRHGMALVGRTRVEDMIIQLELEPAETTWKITGSPLKLSEQPVGEGEFYHVRVTPIDPRSKTRIPYTTITFEAVNKDTGRKIVGEPQPMWGRGGLHYAFNSGLAGDGVYEIKVIVGVPTLARHPRYENRWTRPVAAKFHFRLVGAKLSDILEAGTD